MDGFYCSFILAFNNILAFILVFYDTDVNIFVQSYNS